MDYLLPVNPNSVLLKPSPIVFPDNAQPSTSPNQFSPQDTVKSTTPPPCASRHELSRTPFGRRVTLPSRLADYQSNNALGGEYCGVHNANKAD
ncbi:hypothetical protein ACTXT7_013063 [Hymenolepis weldensis]